MGTDTTCSSQLYQSWSTSSHLPRLSHTEGTIIEICPHIHILRIYDWNNYYFLPLLFMYWYLKTDDGASWSALRLLNTAKKLLVEKVFRKISRNLFGMRNKRAHSTGSGSNKSKINFENSNRQIVNNRNIFSLHTFH